MAFHCSNSPCQTTPYHQNQEEYAKQARLAQTKNPNSIHVPVTPQKYEKFRNEAERHGLTVPEWASEALDALSSIKSRS